MLGIGFTQDPKAFAVGPDGNVYISSRGVTAGSGGRDGPLVLKFGPDGNLYVPGQFSDAVYRYDGRTGAFIDVFASGGLDGATVVYFHTIPAPPSVLALVG